jgi:hypothetical protein
MNGSHTLKIHHSAVRFVPVTVGGVTYVEDQSDFARSLRIEIQSASKDLAFGRRSFLMMVEFFSHVDGQKKTVQLGPFSKRRAERERDWILKAAFGPAPQLAPRGTWVKRGLLAASVSALAYYLFAPLPAPEKLHTAARAFSTPKVAAAGYLTEVNLRNLAAVAGHAGIPVLAKDGYQARPAPFFVFSSFDCAECSQMNEVLASISTEYLPVILPADLSGNNVDDALRVLSHVYCAEVPGDAWLRYSASASTPNDYAQCNWQDRARLAATAGALSEAVEPGSELPVIVAPNGALHTGAIVGPTAQDDLEAWLKANAKPAQTGEL